MALLGADHPAMPGTGGSIDRLTRERQIFRAQNLAGLSWLVSQMRHWPETYRDACWVAWGQLLLLPQSGRSAAVN
jgi:hypothetical protein